MHLWSMAVSRSIRQVGGKLKHNVAVLQHVAVWRGVWWDIGHGCVGRWGSYAGKGEKSNFAVERDRVR